MFERQEEVVSEVRRSVVFGNFLENKAIKMQDTYGP